MEQHITCNCHQCTWLRASQLDRAFIPKSETEKCDCTGEPCTPEISNLICGVGFHQPCLCPGHNPKDYTAETEKCAHNYGALGVGCMPGSGCKGPIIIKDEVEEKIKEIIHEFKWSGSLMNRKYDALRELVELASNRKIYFQLVEHEAKAISLERQGCIEEMDKFFRISREKPVFLKLSFKEPIDEGN